MKKQINNFSRWASSLFDTESKDEIKGCVDIIFKGHTTEQSIYIFNEVRRLYELELSTRYDNNQSENNEITQYFMSVKIKSKHEL